MSQIIPKLQSAHKSITVWFNGVIASIALGLPYAAETFPILKDYVSGHMYKHVMAALIIGNIILHFRPTTRAADKDTK